MTEYKKNDDKYVLAFDPGGTTGMALIRYNDKEVALSVLAQISDAHMGYYDNLVTVPAGLGTPVTPVSEKWVEHGVKGADRTPLVIEGIQYAFWPDQVVYQTPDMKQLISDDTLKEIGVWTEGKRHQMDALIHGLVYLRNMGHKPTLKLLGEEGQSMKMDNGQPGQGKGDQDGDGTGKPNGEKPDDGGREEGGQGGQVPQQIEAGAAEKPESLEHDEGGGDSEEKSGAAGDTQGDDAPPLPAVAAALAFIRAGMDFEEEQEQLALIAETRKHYDRERDLDGAFAGFEPSPTAERRTLIDEDF